MLSQDHKQEQEARELRADYRAYCVFDACRGIAIGLGAKGEKLTPGDVFPSLRALKVVDADRYDIDSEEDVATASFNQLRRGYRA